MNKKGQNFVLKMGIFGDYTQKKIIGENSCRN